MKQSTVINFRPFTGSATCVYAKLNDFDYDYLRNTMITILRFMEDEQDNSLPKLLESHPILGKTKDDQPRTYYQFVLGLTQKFLKKNDISTAQFKAIKHVIKRLLGIEIEFVQDDGQGKPTTENPLFTF